MEVTEIILAKVLRLCDLWSHNLGFSQAINFKFYMSQPMDFVGVVGGGSLFVYLFHFRPYFIRGSFLCQFFFIRYILMKQIQDNQKLIGKSIQAYVVLKISRKKSAKCQMPNFCDFQIKNHALGHGFKNLQKIYSLAYGFLFFVTSISGNFRSYCEQAPL